MSTDLLPRQADNSLFSDRQSRHVSARSLFPFLILAVVSVVAVVTLVLTDGNLYVAGAMIALSLIVVVTFYRLQWGFYLFAAMTFLFDQFSEFDSSMTTLVRYFLTLNTFPQIQSVGVGVLTPVEIHLLFLISAWIILGVLKRDFGLVPVPLWGSTVLLFGWMIVAIGHGRLNGGDVLLALWDTRGLAVFILLFPLVPQVVRTRADVSAVIWILIITVTFKALQAATRFALMGFSFGSWPIIYDTLSNNHEDAIFLVNLFVFFLALVFFGTGTAQRQVLKWLLPVSILGFVAANRRAAFAALGASLITLVPFLPRPKRNTMLSIMGVALVIVGAYLGVFWNNTGRLGTIAQQIKGTLISDPTVSSERNYSSDLARKVENYNLAMTARRHPVTGIGFGMPWDVSIQLWAAKNVGLGHNGILSLFVKSGAIGFFLFWLFFNLYILYCADTFARLQDEYLKAVCLLTVASIIGQLIFSYVDTGLNYTRCMAWIAIMMGLVPVVQRADAQPAVESTPK